MNEFGYSPNQHPNSEDMHVKEQYGYNTTMARQKHITSFTIRKIYAICSPYPDVAEMLCE
jgi:hypothetical protein